MRRLLVTSVLLILVVSQVVAQPRVYPLEFAYDADSDEYYSEVEIQVDAGARLRASVSGGEDVYFYIYSGAGDVLFEGDTLADFVAVDDATIYVEVLSLSEASGELQVIDAGEAPAQFAGSAAAGEFATEPCPFDVPDSVEVTCGVLTVPENRQTGSGAVVQLAVAVIGARAANPLPDPIFYLEGGPGGSALVSIDSWYDTPYRDQRDIVIFDQRGTGFSEPSLNCTEMDEDDSVEAVEECRDRLLDEGIDLTAYNSRENAADVESLRLALGYDQINLYGISYGTRLALTVMRDHPQAIRAVVLDSVYPPNVDTNYFVTTDTYELISQMFSDCEAQPTCADAFPDLEARFYDQLEAIDSAPPEVTDLEGETVELYAQDVINTLVEQLKSTELVSAIPASLDAFASGDFEAYLDLANNGVGSAQPADAVELAQDLAQEMTDDELEEVEDLAASNDTAGIADYLSELFDLTEDELSAASQGFVQLGAGTDRVDSVEPPDIDDDSEGMNMSVQCYEEMPFMTVEEAAARASAVDMPDLVRDELMTGTAIEFEQCAVWPAGSGDPIENAAVVSSIPTLVLSARYDTATPPWWGDLAAETLDRSFNFHFPLVGHGVIDGGACPVSIGLAFLTAPLEEPDSSCIASMNDEFFVP